MKAYILKNRPYKYVLAVVELVNKQVKVSYYGFKTKDNAVTYYDTHCQNCLHACIYKATCTFVNVMHGVKEFFDNLNSL